MRRTYSIQENGQITLPADWRDKHGLKKGDLVSFEETDDGSLKILPRVTLGMEALDKIGQALKEKGITLEQLLEDSDAIREDIYRDKYAPKAEGDA